jgi:membrane-associated phospholipid phosphatase
MTEGEANPSAVLSPQDARLIPAGFFRRAGVVCAAGAALAALTIAFDGPISDFFREAPIAGDLKREMRVLQQWGAPASLALGASVIALLDRARARRLLDLLLGAGITALVVHALKLSIARARPRFGDPGAFFARPEGSEGAADRALESASDLASMPSSHTSAAVVFSVFLVALYPRLLPVGAVMAAIVGVSRLVFGAHYASDVVVGAAIGWLIAWPAVHGRWGVRLVDWVWIRFVDRKATPAYPRLLRIERARTTRTD